MLSGTLIGEWVECHLRASNEVREDVGRVSKVDFVCRSKIEVLPLKVE